MVKRHLRIEGPGAKGTIVNASALKDLLHAVIEGGQRAIRLRVQGRSTATGPTPEWILSATEYDVSIKEGSTVLELSAPTLFEVDPEQFRQTNLFNDVDPTLSAIDYLADTLEAATEAKDRWDAFDRPLLRTLKKDLAPVFDHGVSKISFLDASPTANGGFQFDDGILQKLTRIEKQIPPPRRVRLAGKLDAIRHSDRTFVLITRDGHKLKGAVAPELVDRMQQLWGYSALLAGTAHFAPSGQLQLIEADALTKASEKEETLWSELPTPLSGVELSVAELRAPQGPRSGLNAIIGRWPGEEDDVEILNELQELS